MVNSFTFVPTRAIVGEGYDMLYPYEIKLLEDHIPFQIALEKPLFDNYLFFDKLVSPMLWGWHFQYNNLDVCVSVLSDNTKRFVNGDIEILHLVVDTVITKYQELRFKIELENKNKNLHEALLLIEKKNKQINQIVYNQKAIIDARTKEIRGKNNKLLEISKMNAHNVREPLSRILGIVDIIDHLSAEELHGEALGFLKDSASDLDCTLQKIIAMSDAEIDKFAIK